MWPHVSELAIVLLIVLVLFGAGKVPKIAEDLGKSIKAFRKGLKEEDNKETETKAVEDKHEKN